MSKAALVRCLEKEHPHLRRHGDFYYFREAEAAIQGFALDAAPNGTTVLTFVMPLFDKIEFLHLGLSFNVLEAGPLNAAPSLLCSEIVHKLESEALMERPLDTMGDVASYARRADQRGIYPRWCLALFACTEGDLGSAENIVRGLMDETNNGEIFPTRGLAELSRALEESPGQIPMMLENWKAGNKRAFF